MRLLNNIKINALLRQCGRSTARGDCKNLFRRTVSNVNWFLNDSALFVIDSVPA